MFRQPDIAQIPEQETERHQGYACRRHYKIDADMLRFRNQHRRKEDRRQAKRAIVQAFENKVHDIPDRFPEKDSVDIENVAHRCLNRMKHAFRKMNDLLCQALLFRGIFSGIRLLFRQPAEHVFYRGGGALRVGVRGLLNRIADFRERKNHDQNNQQRTDEANPDMFPELRIIPHNRQQKNAEGNGQGKIMDTQHRRGNQLLNIGG